MTLCIGSRKACNPCASEQTPRYNTRMEKPRMTIFRNWLFFASFVAFSIGWLAPLGIAISWLLRWCEQEQTGAHSDSFPYLGFVGPTLVVAAIWLVLVMVAWSLVLRGLAIKPPR